MLPMGIIDRAAVIWIDEVEFPKFIALVYVRYAGRGQLEQSLRQTIEHPEIRDSALERNEVVEKRFVLKCSLDKFTCCRLILLIRICSASYLLSFSHFFQ